MSNRDETDRAQSADDITPTAEQWTKANAVERADQINGNGNADGNKVTNSTKSLAVDNAAESTTKPNNPSNWVQFENDDDHDKVNKQQPNCIDIRCVCVLVCVCVFWLCLNNVCARLSM